MSLSMFSFRAKQASNKAFFNKIIKNKNLKINTINLSQMEDSERNIEIKAKIGSDEKFEEKMKIAADLTKSKGEKIKQHDIFFNCRKGRLKLRKEQRNDEELSLLVQYDRPDIKGPKLSKFNRINIDDPILMSKILTDSMGVKGEVKKIRTLFWYDQTRIHLDKVEGLGNFLEFEVCLDPMQPIEEGQKIAETLIETFGINPETDLIESAYLDSL